MTNASEKTKILLSIAALVSLATIFAALIGWRLYGAITAFAAPKNLDCGCTATVGWSPQFLILLTAGLLFGSGLLAGASYAALTIFKTRRFTQRLLASKIPTPIAANLIIKKLNLQDQVTFFEAAEFQACTFGLFCPRIAVSRTAATRLSEREFSALLLHEAHHRAERDPLKILILDTLQYTFFFIPLLKYLVKRYKVAAEIEADEKTGDATALGQALLRFTETAFGAAVTASFASALQLRLERLVQKGRPAKSPLPKGLLLLTLLVFGGLGLVADQNSTSTSADSICRFQEIRCLEIMSANRQI